MGVADQVRRTQQIQEQRARKDDMGLLIKMVKEGRLHEADERQLETLKLALELNQLMGEDRQQPVQASISSEDLAKAMKEAVSEVVANLPARGVGGLPADDPARPQMKHVSLADLTQDNTAVNISHKDSVGKEIEGKASSDKLEKLKKLKKTDDKK